MQTLTSMGQTLQYEGDAQLLSGISLAIVGARDCSHRGRQLADRAARWFVSQNCSVVSGGARGIDAIALNAAQEAGGCIIICCPQGLGTFRSKPWKQALDDGRCLLLSQFSYDAGWSTKRAMARNRLIISLAHSVLIGECLTVERGGTWYDIQIANGMDKKPYIRPYVAGKDPLAHKVLLDQAQVRELEGRTGVEQLSKLLPLRLSEQFS